MGPRTAPLPAGPKGREVTVDIYTVSTLSRRGRDITCCVLGPGLLTVLQQSVRSGQWTLCMLGAVSPFRTRISTFV